ncbi:hypothetical protein LPTSP4_18440 [Leptospira ryugenii]|uniref:Uncharacterized protein n=1 Tax=Leptospira ryugenii TaxID=1917863 RepID=A0A2P2E0B4_9LEPT|nr:hypothetical protein [Leptospira ryugenii]GBF50319.1 hypothetical protein LPTSP4_18440 [Leptospira ryugenii]
MNQGKPDVCPDCGSKNIYQESQNRFRCGDCFCKIDARNFSQPKVSPLVQGNQTLSLKKQFLFALSLLIPIAISTKYVFFLETDKNLPVPAENQNVELETYRKFQILTSDAFQDSIGNLFVVGRIKNLEEKVVERPTITVSFLGTSENIIHTVEGYGIAPLLKPNEETMFVALWMESKPYTSYRMEAASIGVYAERESYRAEIQGLKITKTKEHWLVTGLANKTGSTDLKYVELHLLCKNKKGKAIYYLSQSLQEERLRKHESVPFAIQIYQLDLEIASIDIETTAQSIDSP